MFENVGEKIKSWASALFYITTIISVITAIVLWATIEEGEPFYVIGGFIFAILGPLSAWFSSLILYGFGELITTTKKQLALSTQKPQPTINDELPEL